MGHFLGIGDATYFVDDEGKVWGNEHMKHLVAESVAELFGKPQEVKLPEVVEEEVKEEVVSSEKTEVTKEEEAPSGWHMCTICDIKFDTPQGLGRHKTSRKHRKKAAKAGE